MLNEDPFKVLPLTFHTRRGVKDPEFKKFVSYYDKLETQQKGSEEKLAKAISIHRQ